MKKLINDPRLVVREMLEGLVDANPGLALLAGEQVVVRAGAAGDGRVALVSGGGSGHEPAHAGYIGEGMLSAAVVGDVFTSPSVDAVLAAIRHLGGGAGVLLIVKNYTGDRLNFGLAAELARAEGIPVEMVIVADDVALSGKVAADRRRGIAGTVLVHKLAGAAAAAGKNLAETAAIARAAAADVRSMGVGLGVCIVPAAGKPGFELGDDEIELGLGIHGEKGVSRTKASAADTLVDSLLAAILEDMRPVVRGSRVALLVNGLGGTPPMELAIVMRRALASLRANGLDVRRAFMGNFMTALEMPGFSLSVLPVDDRRLELLDAPTEAPAWPRSGAVAERRGIVPEPAVATAPTVAGVAGPLAGDMRLLVARVAERLVAAEATLTELDAKAGDGDLGASMARAAAAIGGLPPEAFATPSTLLLAMSGAVRRAVGGSSGPFYASGLARAAATLREVDRPDAKDWQNALGAAIEAIVELGGAKRGDRTMLDALMPALDAWRDGGDLATAARAADKGAEATAAMTPQQGRASYLSERALGVPDGGAVAVAIWLGAVAEGLVGADGT